MCVQTQKLLHGQLANISALASEGSRPEVRKTLQAWQLSRDNHRVTLVLPCWRLFLYQTRRR